MAREAEITLLIARAIPLIGSGFHLIPLGLGPQEKRPTVRWRYEQPPTVDAFKARIDEIGKPMYGIKLSGMVVLDLDERDDELLNRLEKRFGRAAVVVETTRGTHLYYAYAGGKLPRLKTDEGMPVDVKFGDGAFVVGPCSARSSGATYREVRGTLGVTKLTPFHDNEGAATRSIPNIAVGLKPKKQVNAGVKAASNGSLVPEGNRHSYLLSSALEKVRYCTSAEELLSALLRERDARCAEPSSVPDDEVKDIADWTFKRFRDGLLFGGSGGFFHVPRHFALSLRLEPEAASLLMLLLDQHGHMPGKAFGLCHKSMKAHGLTALSTRRFDHAIKVLLKVGAIAVAAKHQAGKSSRQYRLQPPSQSSLQLALSETAA